MAVSLYQMRAREMKARTVANWIRDNRPDLDADLAERLNRFGRDCIVQLAGIHADPPSQWQTISDFTWEMVVSRLRHPTRLTVVPDDPFDGLEGN